VSLLHKLLPELFLPLGVSLMLLAFGLWRTRRWPVVTAFLLLLVASNPLVAGVLMRLAEGHAVRLAASDVPPADAIVVLSAGRVVAPGSRPVSEWVEADRFFGGLELWRAGKAPLLVFTRPPSVGLPENQTEGDLLASLARELSVPADRILLTAFVSNTADEARETATLLPQGARILLVTSAFHMPRARRQFEAAGLAVEPFPVDFRESARHGWTIMDIVPSPNTLGITHTALREWYGRAFYRMF